MAIRNKLTGKQINEFAAARCDLPQYFGDRYWPPEHKYGTPPKKVNGELLAKKYNSIVEIAIELKATAHLKKTAIVIEHTNGQFVVGRDILSDCFLRPLLHSNIGFSTVE